MPKVYICEDGHLQPAGLCPGRCQEPPRYFSRQSGVLGGREPLRYEGGKAVCGFLVQACELEEADAAALESARRIGGRTAVTNMLKEMGWLNRE